jgi:hypothetical protein
MFFLFINFFYYVAPGFLYPSLCIGFEDDCMCL